MRRLFMIMVMLLAIVPPACAADDQGQSTPRERLSRSDLMWVPGRPDLFRIGDTFFGEPVWLRWPDKKVSLDVKDIGISAIADSLREQTGIEFIIGEGVPADLKITIHVNEMGIKDLLETLTSTTGLVYFPESRTAEDALTQPDQGKEPSPDKGNPPKGWVQHTESGNPEKVFTLRRAQVITHVTILNPRTEGIVLNMGKVSVSLRNTDPIRAVSNLMSQIKGASYVVMQLDDYLALQSPDQVAQIKKALTKTSRRKVTLELRNAGVADALTQLSNAGNFYITIPKPGVPSFLIIPDVKIANQDALPSPSIEYWSSEVREAREQKICVEYTKQMLTAVLDYAKQNAGVLPDATLWVQLIPIQNEYLEKRMPGGRYQYSYGMNMNLSNMKLSDIKKPSKTVLIFECDNNRGFGTEKDIIRTTRHPGGIVYGFADGSVKILTEKPSFKP